jgi:hypothetical protein
MATITTPHCTVQLTILEPHKSGNWFKITLSMTYHRDGQSVEFKAPWYGVLLQEPELIKFVQQAKHYLESPAPHVLSKERRNHKYWFSPMECGFSIELHSYSHPEDKSYTSFTFEMSLRDFKTSESVGCVFTLPTEEVLIFINEIEKEYEKVR